MIGRIQRIGTRWPLVAAAHLMIGLLCIAQGGTQNVTIEQTEYQGWNGYRMSNGEVELIAVTDVGPRILRFGFQGGNNLFFVGQGTEGVTGGDTWRGYGGHRFWIAPETEFTYYPDNDKVHAEIAGNNLILTSPAQLNLPALRKHYPVETLWSDYADDPAFKDRLNLQKTVTISMADDGEVMVEHRAVNVGAETMRIAPWALTVMDKEGLSINPNPPFAPHGPDAWLPVRTIITWSYTYLTDPRLKFTEKYALIRQDPNATGPFKIGFSYTQGWAAYALGQDLFVKFLEYDEDAEYPDMGSSVEIYTDRNILEVESLGPLRDLEPGDSMTLTERWRLYKMDRAIEPNDESVDAALRAVGLIQ